MLLHKIRYNSEVRLLLGFQAVAFAECIRYFSRLHLFTDLIGWQLPWKKRGCAHSPRTAQTEL